MQDQCVVCPCKDHDWQETKTKIQFSWSWFKLLESDPKRFVFITYLKTVKLWGNVSS